MHPEVKHRRGNNCAADDQHFTIALFYGKVAQMFLHDLQMIRLPQPFVLLLVVVDHWLEEFDLGSRVSSDSPFTCQDVGLPLIFEKVIAKL
ncbi:hypothetical protein ACLBR5_07060 [Escherichia coli]